MKRTILWRLLASTVLTATVLVMIRLADASQKSEAYSKEVVSRGEYLVMLGGCGDCHTTKKFSAQGPEPDLGRHMAGAPAHAKVPAVPAGALSPTGWGVLGSQDMTTWAGPWGVSFAANLTPDNKTGIGMMTEAMFVKSMRTGKHRGMLRDILPPMPWQSLAKASDEDLRAIFAYLKSLPPIDNRVPDPIPPAR
jgi:mono/diheme cytochrome c family protein